MTPITNLFTIQNLIHYYEKKYQREQNSVRLLVVSKGQPPSKIAEIYRAGQLCFGESYLQEALPKISLFPDIEWHFIGPIQSNKTRKLAEHFAWVQSIDNAKIAQRLNDQRPNHLPPLNICIQLNISREFTKSGIIEQDLFKLTEYCSNLPRLKLRGLMSIPAPTIDVAEQRKQFHQLFLLYQTLKQQGFDLDILSMGMSDDFEAAVAEGSTLVRIGTAVTT